MWITITRTVVTANFAHISSLTASNATLRQIADNANQDFTLMMITIAQVAASSNIVLPATPRLIAKPVSQVMVSVLTTSVKIAVS